MPEPRDPNQQPTGANQPAPDSQDWFWSRPDAVPPQDEPTQQLGATEPTQVIGQVSLDGAGQGEPARVLGGAGQGEPTRVFGQLPPGEAPAGESAQDHGEAQWQPPTGQPRQPPQQQVGPQQAGPQQPGQQAPYPQPGFQQQDFQQPPQQPVFQPAQPSGATPGSKQKTSRARSLLALVAVGAVASVALTQAPAILTGPAVSTPSASQPALPESQQGGAAQPGTGTDTDNPWNQPRDEQGGVPAEQRPWDPWGQSSQGSGSGTEAGTTQSGSRQRTATAAESAGVVLISTRSAAGQGAGSGMVISADGLVLTNYHVVQSSTEVVVEVASTGRTYQASVVGHDAIHDVALLQLDQASNLQTVTMDDDQAAVGDSVTAVGNSEGQGFLSAAEGRITDLDSSITVSSETAASGSERLSGVLKTTAPALPGDSGGPMFDQEGEVVGILTAGEQAASSRGQAVTVASYGVPIEDAMQIVEQIQQDKEEGTVRVGPNAYLGVSVLASASGQVAVTSTVEGGPAAQAGIERGSVLTELDGNRVTSHAELAATLAEHEPGDQVAVEWTDANGRRQSGRVTLGSSPVN